MKSTLLGFIVIFLLAACQTNPTTEADGDSTGSFASPTKEDSPADIYVQLAIAYLNESNATEALRNAKKAILIDENSAGAHNVIALVYQRLGEIELSEKHYKKAIAIEPKNAYVLNAYGSLLCGLQRFDSADDIFNRALKNPLYPTPWIVRHNMGLCADKKGDKVEAEKNFRRALQMNSRFSPSLLTMSRVSLEKGKYLSGRAYLQRYAQAASHTADSLWLGVQIEQKLGNTKQVDVYSAELRKSFPDSDPVQYLK